jgi:hypothetical protein
MTELFVIAGVALVAFDQIRERDAAIAGLHEELAAARAAEDSARRGVAAEAAALREELEGIAVRHAGRDADIADLAGKLIPMAAENQTLRERLEDALAANARLASKAVQPPAPAVNRLPADSQAVTPSAASDLPWWKPELRTKVDALIRSEAEAKWGQNYSMIEYEINLQIEAYDKILNYNKTWKHGEKQIIARAVAKWAPKWNMVVYEIERQTEALGRLNGK